MQQESYQSDEYWASKSDFKDAYKIHVPSLTDGLSWSQRDGDRSGFRAQKGLTRHVYSAKGR